MNYTEDDVERVARAIWNTHIGAKRYPWETLGTSRETYIEYARAALAAMPDGRNAALEEAASKLDALASEFTLDQPAAWTKTFRRNVAVARGALRMAAEETRALKARPASGGWNFDMSAAPKDGTRASPRPALAGRERGIMSNDQTYMAAHSDLCAPLSDKRTTLARALALIAAAEKATPAHWKYWESHDAIGVISGTSFIRVCGDVDPSDADFIVAARNDAPGIARALVEAVEVMRLVASGSPWEASYEEMLKRQNAARAFLAQHDGERREG